MGIAAGVILAIATFAAMAWVRHAFARVTGGELVPTILMVLGLLPLLWAVALVQVDVVPGLWPTWLSQLMGAAVLLTMACALLVSGLMGYRATEALVSYQATRQTLDVDMQRLLTATFRTAFGLMAAVGIAIALAWPYFAFM